MGRDRALAGHLASRGGLPGLTLEVLSVSLLGWLITVRLATHGDRQAGNREATSKWKKGGIHLSAVATTGCVLASRSRQ